MDTKNKSPWAFKFFMCARSASNQWEKIQPSHIWCAVTAKQNGVGVANGSSIIGSITIKVTKKYFAIFSMIYTLEQIGSSIHQQSEDLLSFSYLQLDLGLQLLLALALSFAYFL